jgi:hypothetical protein
MWQVEMAEKLKHAAPRDRKTILAPYAEMSGYSMPHLYTVAKQYGWESGRKKRADAGECSLTESQIEFVAGLMRESARENKGVIMPVERAIEIAVDNGIIPRGLLSVGRMQQVLAEKQLNKSCLDAATPHTDMRSLHPNHVHLIDASVCIQYYLKNGKTALIDERDFNEKKMQNMEKIKTRITRYVLTDHFSGLFFVKYYLADGESQKLLFDFLVSAWQHKHNEQYPFRGVPFLILWDAASAARAKAMKHFINGLKIETPDGMPHNPRRQGSVETTQNIVERWFESSLRFQPAFSIEQLNAWAQDWMIFHNATKNHTRHGMKRTECWMLIKQEQLRELPDLDVLQTLFRTPGEERLVGGNYQITYQVRAGEIKKYWLKHIPGLMPGRSKVLVQLNPYLWPTVNVKYNEISYEVAPLDMLPANLGAFRADAPIIGQEYAAMPETATQQAGKRIENYAYGELPEGETRRRGDAVPFAGITVMGNQAEKLGTVAYMPRKGSAIEIDRAVADKQIPIAELFTKLVAAGVEMTKEINKELREKYGATIDSKEAEAVVNLYSRGGAEIAEKAEHHAEGGQFLISNS